MSIIRLLLNLYLTPSVPFIFHVFIILRNSHLLEAINNVCKIYVHVSFIISRTEIIIYKTSWEKTKKRKGKKALTTSTAIPS